MANTITAGNGTNNGLAVTSDATGALNILTGSGAGTAAISIDSSQNVTAAANLSVTGNATITGTLSASGGITGSLKSATAQASTSGTSIDFTSIPSGVKRITVMFNGVSTNGTSLPQVQIGTSGTPTTTGYVAATSLLYSSIAISTSTTGFPIYSNQAASVFSGTLTISNISGNAWIASGVVSNSAGTSFTSTTAGNLSLAGVLNMVRITTVNGTDTFDAGSINIIYE